MYSPEEIYYKLEDLERLIRDFDGSELPNLENFMIQTANSLRVIPRDLAETKAKVDEVKAYIDLEKNRLTRDAAIRNISKIVKEWESTLLGLALGDDVIALANSLLDKDRVESFSHTDLVLTVSADGGVPHYIVVEVSYLIETDVVERVILNALELYCTGVISYGAVIGCEFTPDAAEKVNADPEFLLFYQIPARELFGK